MQAAADAAGRGGIGAGEGEGRAASAPTAGASGPDAADHGGGGLEAGGAGGEGEGRAASASAARAGGASGPGGDDGGRGSRLRKKLPRFRARGLLAGSVAPPFDQRRRRGVAVGDLREAVGGLVRERRRESLTPPTGA